MFINLHNVAIMHIPVEHLPISARLHRLKHYGGVARREGYKEKNNRYCKLSTERPVSFHGPTLARTVRHGRTKSHDTFLGCKASRHSCIRGFSASLLLRTEFRRSKHRPVLLPLRSTVRAVLAPCRSNPIQSAARRIQVD